MPWTVLAMLMSASTAVAAADEPALAVEAPDPSHVYGGSAAGTCEWPTTVSLGGCTGTLVHPELVIYAAHCGGVSSVFLGESTHGPGRTIHPQYCKTYPGGGPGNGTDWAFCKLSQPVTDIPITPPLMGCETEVLKQGKKVWLVGFGYTEYGTFGVKYKAEATFNYIQNNEAFIGGGGVDTCQGDSGGPVYVQLDDGSWRAFGITSYGGQCGGGGWYSMMHPGMAWFESESGLDLTPCHDADGTWNPGPDCKGFPLEPGKGGGSWPNACEGGALSSWGDSCGPSHAATQDVEPPRVEIVTPVDGARFDTGATDQAEVTVVVHATDDVGVAEVHLVVDGETLAPADTEPPWERTLQLGPGLYELSAIAIDFADNSAESDVVRIGVDMAADGDDDDPAGTGGVDGHDDDGADGGERPDDGPTAGDDAFPPGFGRGDAEVVGCTCRHGTPAVPGMALLLLLGLATRRRPA